MPYSTNVLESERIIKVSHFGEVDLQELESARRESKNLMKEKEYKRVLVDTRDVTNILSMTEHLVFNASHKGVFNVNIKIGVVFDPKTYAYNKYVEDVSQNTGTNLRAFEDEDKAKEWLLN